VKVGKAKFPLIGMAFACVKIRGQIIVSFGSSTAPKLLGRSVKFGMKVADVGRGSLRRAGGSLPSRVRLRSSRKFESLFAKFVSQALCLGGCFSKLEDLSGDIISGMSCNARSP
jgi:hypothetical protein